MFSFLSCFGGMWCFVAEIENQCQQAPCENQAEIICVHLRRDKGSVELPKPNQSRERAQERVQEAPGCWG